MNVVYLFTRYKFGWNEIDYSLYATFNVVAHMAGRNLIISRVIMY